MRNTKISRYFRKTIFPALALSALVLTGCATSGRTALQPAEASSSEGPLNITTVRQEPAAHELSEVAWGGVVAGIENRQDATWIEVIERPLNRKGQPDTTSRSGGRFLAVVPEFLDPADYRTGLAITVVGNIQGTDTRPIGEASYDYTKVSVVEHQLWLPSTRLAGRRGYYSPYRGKLSVGFGSRRGFGFGFSRGFGFGHGKFGGFHGRKFGRAGRFGSGRRGFRRH